MFDGKQSWQENNNCEFFAGYFIVPFPSSFTYSFDYLYYFGGMYNYESGSFCAPDAIFWSSKKVDKFSIIL
jgi:hypothetical protein